MTVTIKRRELLAALGGAAARGARAAARTDAAHWPLTGARRKRSENTSSAPRPFGRLSSGRSRILLVPHDVWRRPLSGSARPIVTTYKTNTGVKPHRRRGKRAPNVSMRCYDRRDRANAKTQ